MRGGGDKEDVEEDEEEDEDDVLSRVRDALEKWNAPGEMSPSPPTSCIASLCCSGVKAGIAR